MLLCPLLIGGPSAYEHSEGGRPRRVGGRGEIAQMALLAHGDRGLAFGAHVLARALARHLLFGEGGELPARERLHEGHQVVDLRLGEAEPLHAAVEVRVRHAALVVVIHHVPERGERAVVHVGRRDGDVAESGRLEGADVVRLLGDQEAPELGEVGLDGELVHLLQVSRAHGAGRLARQVDEVGLVRGDADVVELLVGEERAHGREGVAGVAAALAVEEAPAALGSRADRLLVARDETVEGRVPGVLGALEGGDRRGDVVVGRVVAEDAREGLAVLREGAHLGDHVVGRLLAHLDRVQDGELRLLLERRRAPVPELGRVEHRVEHRRAVALRALGGRGHAVGHRLVVDEAARGVVAGGARHLVVDREALVVEQLVAERDLVRRWRRRGRDGKLVEDGGDAAGEPPLQRGGEPGGERRACEHETLPADQHGPSFRVTASVYSTSTARRGAGLLPRVAAHQLGLAERVPPDGLQERRLGRAGRKLGDGVQRVEPEGVAVRRTARRTGPAVPGAAKVVRALPAAVVQRRRGPHALGAAGGARRHAVQHPVHPGARGRVGVVAHEREALRPRRRIGPGERGREILPVASVLAGDRVARLEGARLELEGHGCSSRSHQGGGEGDRQPQGATARHGRETSRAGRACPGTATASSPSASWSISEERQWAGRPGCAHDAEAGRRSARWPGGDRLVSTDPHPAMAGGSRAEEAALRDAHRAETDRLLRSRLDLTVVLFLVFVGASVVIESMQAPTRGRPVMLVYALEGLACLLAVVACRLPGFLLGPRAIAAALASTLAALLSAYNASVGGSVERLAMAQVCLLTGVVVLLPWGWRAQLVVAGAAFASFGLALPHLFTSDNLLMSVLALVTGTTTTTWGAFFLERYRTDAMLRAARQAAEAEIAATLLRVGETLDAHLGRPDMLERVNRLVVESLGCDWSSIFVYDEAHQAFRLYSNVGSSPAVVAELADLEFPWDSLPLLDALRPGAVLEMAGTGDQDLVPPDLMRRLGMASSLCAPICRREEIIGTLSSGYRTRTGPFSAKQRRLALGIANAIAVALENARLIADLQSASRLKSEFVATMSHELRTPLNVITGYADLLVEGTFGPLTTEQRDTIERVRRSAFELLDLVNATLDLGRLEAGRETVERTPVDLDALFAELGGELDPLVPPAVALHWQNRVGRAPVLTDRVTMKTG